MDARTLKRVDVEAARKVTADTSFGALIPEGILHKTSAVLGPTMSLVGISKQLPFSPFPSMLQLRNKSRGCKRERDSNFLLSSTFHYFPSLTGYRACNEILYQSVFQRNICSLRWD
jgi:hypothetical protein